MCALSACTPASCAHAPLCLSDPPPAVGCAKLGQLLVWDWRSDSYVLKQQGHYFDISAVAFSPDGALIATGSDDRKVRRADVQHVHVLLTCSMCMCWRLCCVELRLHGPKHEACFGVGMLLLVRACACLGI